MPCMYLSIFLLFLGPIGLVNLLTAKACGASKVCITGISEPCFEKDVFEKYVDSKDTDSPTYPQSNRVLSVSFHNHLIL